MSLQSSTPRLTIVTITSVVPAPEGGAATIHQSCGHNYRLAAIRACWPKVGDEQRCSSCDSERWDAEHPKLPDERIAAITASLPTCPTCGGPIAEVHFIAHQTHAFSVEVDEYDGGVNASSELVETLDVEPNGRWRTGALVSDGPGLAHRTPDVFAVEVTCKDGHLWMEPRLKLTRRDGNYVTWDVLPKPAPMLCLTCGSDQHTYPECPTRPEPATMRDVQSARAQTETISEGGPPWRTEQP